MTKFQKISTIILSAIISVLFIAGLAISNNKAYAETIQDNKEIHFEGETNVNEITPRLFASLSLAINGGDRKVSATVRNDFTLFPSTVNVIVQLFYSYEYCEDFNKMTLAKIVSTDDLDMGHTITAEASTEGEERFWLARMRCRENSGDWQVKEVSARYSAEGVYLGIA